MMRSSTSPFAVSMITGMFAVRPSCLSRRRIEMPSSPGSMMSRRISSGIRPASMASQNAAPSEKPTASKPLCLSAYSSKSRMLSSSST